MANYNFVIDSSFLPYNWTENLENALKSYYEDYEEAYEEYKAMELENATLQSMINNIDSNTISNTYNDYTQALENYGNNFLEGYSINDRKKSALELQKQYRSTILPIETLILKKLSWIDEQRKLKSTNSNLIFDKDATKISIEDMIANPNMNYQMQDASIIANEAAVLTKALGLQIASNTIEDLGNNTLLYLQSISRLGYNSNEIFAAIKEDSLAPLALKNMVKTLKDKYHIDNNNSFNDKVDNAIAIGMMSEVGNIDITNLLNRAYEQYPDYENELRELNLAKANRALQDSLGINNNNENEYKVQEITVGEDGTSYYTVFKNNIPYKSLNTTSPNPMNDFTAYEHNNPNSGLQLFYIAEWNDDALLGLYFNKDNGDMVDITNKNRLPERNRRSVFNDLSKFKTKINFTAENMKDAQIIYNINVTPDSSTVNKVINNFYNSYGNSIFGKYPSAVALKYVQEAFDKYFYANDTLATQYLLKSNDTKSKQYYSQKFKEYYDGLTDNEKKNLLIQMINDGEYYMVKIPRRGKGNADYAIFQLRNTNARVQEGEDVYYEYPL